MLQPRTAGSPPACVLDGVAALDLALERRALYPQQHPLVAAARDAYVRAWLDALSECGPIRLWIAAGRLGWGAGEIDALPGPRMAPLSRLLHAMRLTSIEADRDAGAADLLALLDLVQALRFDLRPVDTIRRWQAESRDRSVRVECLDVDSFRYGDRHLDTPAGETWAGLHRYLSGETADPAAVARSVADMLNDQELLGLGTLRANLSARLERAHARGDVELAERVRRLVAALPEPMRADLLRIDAPTGSAALAQLVRGLPPRDALGLVLQLGQAGGTLPAGTRMILTRILHCLPDGSEAAHLALRAPDGEPPDVALVACALESVFAVRTDQDFNPEEYQRRLDELAREENLRFPDAGGRAESLSDARELAAQTGGIAALSLAGAAPEELCAALERVDRALPLLLERRRLDLVAVTARAMRATQGADTEAADRITAGLAAHLETLFALGSSAEGGRDDLRAVLALVPAADVGRAALRHLLAGTAGLDPHLLHETLMDRDGDTLADLLDAAVDEAPERIERLCPVLGAARSAEVRRVLERFLLHGDARIRRAALTIAVGREGVSRHLSALERAVSDPDGDIARWALQRLASSPEGADDVTDALGRILETRAERLSEFVSSRLMLLLVQRGPRGGRRAAAALDRFRRTWRPRAARIAWRIAARLALLSDDPDVNATLRRWRRSPARWLALLPVGEKEVTRG